MLGGFFYLGITVSLLLLLLLFIFILFPSSAFRFPFPCLGKGQPPFFLDLSCEGEFLRSGENADRKEDAVFSPRLLFQASNRFKPDLSKKVVSGEITAGAKATTTATLYSGSGH